MINSRHYNCKAGFVCNAFEGRGEKKGERFRSLPVAGKFFHGFGGIVGIIIDKYRKNRYIEPHDIEFRFQINKSMIDLWDSDEKEYFARSLYRSARDGRNFEFLSPLFSFSFFRKNCAFGENADFDKTPKTGGRGQKSRFL